MDREIIYKREEEAHDDENFNVMRSEMVGHLYSGYSFQNIYRCADRFLGSLKDKKLLEIGCGSGSKIQKFADSGCIYTGIDISGYRIEQANELIKEKNIKNAFAVKMNSEKMTFSDGEFDVVFGEAIIHHLDMDITMKEVSRILKNNGYAVFIEPRGSNPLYNWYRHKTPEIRTIDEQPLLMKDFGIMKKYFKVYEKNFYFVSISSLFFRKVIKIEPFFRVSKFLLDKVDQLIFKIIPFLGRYGWFCVIKLEKK